MKKRIVVDNKAFLNKTDFVCIEDIVKDLKVEYKIEKCPTSFEELKELCEDKYKYVFTEGYETEYIVIKHKYFTKDGKIFDYDWRCFADNLTPQQMWGIIKNLIGEE